MHIHLRNCVTKHLFTYISTSACLLTTIFWNPVGERKKNNFVLFPKVKDLCNYAVK